MVTNLVMISGLLYVLIGAFIMLLAHRSLYRRATAIVAGYPRVLAALRMQRHDSRFGLTILLCGNVLQVLAAAGFALPLAYWLLPAAFIGCLLLTYAAWRVFSGRRIARSRSAPKATQVPRVFETRRSWALLQAARSEAANRRARELARAPRDRSVVYVAQEWDCRWWSDRFGVTPEVLRATVRQIGPMVRDLEHHFKVRNVRARAA
jgi:hypothetical protein